MREEKKTGVTQTGIYILFGYIVYFGCNYVIPIYICYFFKHKL